MKISVAITFGLGAIGFTEAFQVTRYPVTRSVTSKSSLFGSADEERTQRMKEILAEEANNPSNMAQSAEMLKNMKPEDVDRMLQEIENMSPAQVESMKAMGMNPDLMKQSMQMMKQNPAMMETMRKMMNEMTPEQMLEQSRIAQERMASMTPEQVAAATSTAASLDTKELEKAAENVSKMGTSKDPMVVTTMFAAAEYMSLPASGGVTFQAFSTLPPISILSGDREEDLSKDELLECWANGSLGASRVDREGFERVWNEVQDYFEEDIVVEARKTAAKKAGGPATSAPTKPVEVVPTPTAAASAPSAAVGQQLTEEQMKMVNERAKNLSDSDMEMMLDQMSNLDPESEARMKAMGVDPAMMKRASSMMKDNPMMRKAAQMMMKNMSPDMMMKASQQAQEQMKNMRPEDLEKAMKEMEAGKK